MRKILIIRFSSYGDIAQALPAAQALRQSFPESEIHWLTRNDFYDFVKLCPAVDRVWALNRKGGIEELFKILRQLRKEGFTHVYDAHHNLRSFIVRNYLRLYSPLLNTIKRSKNRIKRFLLFKLKINLFEKPFRGSQSYISPLKKWIPHASWPNDFRLQFDESTPKINLENLSRRVCIAPSAAWELKRWPAENWRELIKLMPQTQFLVLGGPEDTVCAQIAEPFKDRVTNLAGRLSWSETAWVISQSALTISADTGTLHVADILGKKTLALIGPTAFGHPTRNTTQVLEVPLSCRPCTKDGRGQCRNSVYQACMRNILPAEVAQFAQAVLQS